MKQLLLLTLLMIAIIAIAITQFNKTNQKEHKAAIPTVETIQETQVEQANEIPVPDKIEVKKEPKHTIKRLSVPTGIQREEKIQIAKKSTEALEREVLTDLKKRMTNTMQKMPDCYQNAQDKEEAMACSKIMHEINKEFSLMLGIPTDAKYEKAINDFRWDEETKTNYIQGIDQSIAPMQELFDCMIESHNPGDKTRCLSIDEETEIDSKENMMQNI